MVKVGYSLAMKGNPVKKEEPPKAYASLQTNGIIDIIALAKHMSEHNSKYSRGDIVAVLMQCVDCMREKLIEGYKIDLGDLGVFSPSISSEGANTMEEFTAENIKSFNVNFAPSPYLKNLRDLVNFEYVASRTAQAAVAKAEKAGDDTVDLAAAKAKP